MLNLDQFKALGIASKASVETLDTYEDNIREYEEQSWTYIPIPSAEKYYHIPDEELRDIEEEQYFHPDLPMMKAFDRLLEYPFLIHDRFMGWEIAPESSDRQFIPTGESEYDVGDDLFPASDIIENPDGVRKKLAEADLDGSKVDAILDVGEKRYSIVTLADVNKRRAREMYYHALSEFEIQLADLVKTEFPNSLIKEVDEDEIERWYRAKIDNLEIHIAEHMQLSTLLTVGGKTEKICEDFGFTSRKKFDKNLGGLVDLRHKIMHPTRGLVHNKEDLKKEIDRLDRLDSALNELDGDQIQPDYPKTG